MPIPPAHPAAVLPFRRLNSRHLSFAALIVGSLSPDFAYAIDDLWKFSDALLFVFGNAVRQSTWVKEQWDWDDFSHTTAGILFFCIPCGLLALQVFYKVRQNLVARFPNPHRDALTALAELRAPSFSVQLVSLLIGAFSHMLWDWFTNSDRWLAQHWSALSYILFVYHGKPVHIYRVLWLVSSIGGVIAVAVSYINFLKSAPRITREESDRGRYFLWLGVIVVGLLVAAPLAQHFADFRTEHFTFLHRLTGFFLAIIVLEALTLASAKPRAAKTS